VAETLSVFPGYENHGQPIFPGESRSIDAASYSAQSPHIDARANHGLVAAGATGVALAINETSLDQTQARCEKPATIEIDCGDVDSNQRLCKPVAKPLPSDYSGKKQAVRRF